MTIGWTLGWLAGLSTDDRFTLLLEFTARNLAITALAGITVLGRADLVLFATLFFRAQVPLILALRPHRLHLRSVSLQNDSPRPLSQHFLSGVSNRQRDTTCIQETGGLTCVCR